MIDQDLRDQILAEPEVLLEDRDVMNALIGANERLDGQQYRRSARHRDGAAGGAA